MNWMQTPKSDNIAKAAQNKAWESFLKKYAKADESKFVVQPEFATSHTTTAESYNKAGASYIINVFGSDSKYWSDEMKKKTLIGPSCQQREEAVSFQFLQKSFKKIFNSYIDIDVVPHQYFRTEFKEVLRKRKIKHTTGKE